METKNKVDQCRSCPYKASEHCIKCVENPSRRKGKNNNPWSKYYVLDKEREQLKEVCKNGK